MAEGVSRIGVLGPFTLEQHGGSVPLPSGRQRSLLALFLMAGGVPLSRDRLIDELWGGRPPPSAVSALHVHLSKVRDLVGGLLVREPAGYALRAGEFELDSVRFDLLVGAARSDPAQARRLLGEAFKLVRGDPLCEVTCDRSLAEWQRTLEENRLQALMLRFEVELAAGAAGELVAELEALISDLAALPSAAFDAGGAVGELSVPLRADHANLRAAFTDAVDDGDQESAAAVALGLRPLWIAGYLRQESDELVERLLERFSLPGEQELALLRILAALEEPAAKWQRRFADRAAELADYESLGVATTQLFAEAINERDYEEMRRLRARAPRPDR